MNKEFRKFLEYELCNLEEVCENIAYGYEAGIYDSYTYILKKYDESHKPVVVPKFVADHIEFCKSKDKRLNAALSESPEGRMVTEMGVSWVEASEIYARAWLDGFTVEEEPKYYALIKGHEMISDDTHRYWNLDSDGVFLSDRHPVYGWKVTKMSKSEWVKFGINDSNADFVEVEEVEEWSKN